LKQESLILIFPCEDIAVSKVLTTAVIIIRSALSLEKAPSITEHISCILTNQLFFPSPNIPYSWECEDFQEGFLSFQPGIL
jgi:hypothetical protein